MGGAQSYRKLKTEIRGLLILGVFVLPLCCSSAVKAQGGPPFYTTDPGTPGPNSWEINLAYMPFCTAIRQRVTCRTSISITAWASESN